MPANVPKFQVKANYPGEISGVDVADIQGKPHIILVNYYICCIFEWQLKSLHSADVIEALKSIVCDIGAPDKLISDNASYFVSEEFEDFMMKWSILHIILSPQFPHGNARAEKAVHVVKQIYLKASDVKLALLLLKMTPIANQSNFVQDAPANLLFGCQLKAHLPIRCHKQNTCNFDDGATSEVSSK